MVLCDEVDQGYDESILPFSVIHLRDLATPDLEEMSKKYNITEFNTSIKPSVFQCLFEHLEQERVVYLDPDIALFGEISEVLDAFDRGAECVLTPHILQPAESVEMSDQKILLYGVYNLGFLGIQNTEDVIKIVNWWGRRLKDDCRVDLRNGIFTDQKWVDLFPAFLNHIEVLRHPGYNVAYWNLPQRCVKKTGDRWQVNGEDLKFFHFSGYDFDNPTRLSRHSSDLDRSKIDVLAEYEYTFGWDGASGTNLHTPRPLDESLTSAPKYL